MACSFCNSAGCPLCQTPKGVLAQLRQRLQWKWWRLLTTLRLMLPSHRAAVLTIWREDPSLFNARHYTKVHMLDDGSIIDHRDTLAFPTFAGFYNMNTKRANMTPAQAQYVWSTHPQQETS